MHMHGEPQTMQRSPMEGDAVPQVRRFPGRACRRAARARASTADRIAWDPGIGFGKTVEQNFALLARQHELLAGGYPLLAGWSRKSSLGDVTGLPVNDSAWPPAWLPRCWRWSAARISCACTTCKETVAALKVCARHASMAQQSRQGIQSMSRTYFGTDGIRGTVGQPPITPDFVLRLAHAVGRVLKKTESRPTVLIGKDTRISGYMLESALESGFNSAGVDVVLLGPLPTPGVAYLTRAQRASLGVVISASHNPFPDNGIKFFSAQGTKLPDEWEIAVEAVLQEAPVWADSATLGKARRLDDAPGRYIEFCKSTFANDLTLRGMTIVVDAAHGAAYQIAPKVFHELGAEVVGIGCSPDGLNINDKVGATHPQALVDAVKAQRGRLRHRPGRRRRPAAAGGRGRAALQRRRTAVPDGHRPPGPRRDACPAWSAR